MTKKDDEEEEGIKVILVGEAGTGKTSLINTAVGKKFVEGTQISSMTCSFVKLTKVLDDMEYTINLWDTIGQERFRSLTKVFFKNSEIVIFVFDITSKASFDSLEFWYDTVEKEIGSEPIKGLAANKQDLFEKQEVEDDDIKKYARDKGLVFEYTTATTPHDFDKLLTQLLKQYIKKWAEIDKKKVIGKKLVKEKVGEKKKKKKFC